MSCEFCNTRWDDGDDILRGDIIAPDDRTEICICAISGICHELKIEDWASDSDPIYYPISYCPFCGKRL